jgi:nucleoside phosphorylase
MSSSGFDAFSDTGAAVAGEAACQAFVQYLRKRGRGQRIAARRIAADLQLDEDTVQELLELACSPEIGLLERATQVRCPCCDERIEREGLLAELRLKGECLCRGCGCSIDNPAELAEVDIRYRLSDAADAEVDACQRAVAAKPVMRAVVLCALLVELRAVRAQMEACGDVGEQVVAGGEIYLTVTLAGEHIAWEVFAACSERSNPAAAASLANAVNSFKPEVALFVGVAGGIPGKVGLGDVVAATTVFDYDQGKETSSGYEPREVQLHSAFDLTQRALHVASSEQWKVRVKSARTEIDQSFTAHVEPIAAGGKVVAASRSPTAELIASIAPRAIAVETEGAGFLAAVRRFKDVSGIVVRGISDLLDGKKASDRAGSQERAAANAAAFAFEILVRFQKPR